MVILQPIKLDHYLRNPAVEDVEWLCYKMAAVGKAVIVLPMRPPSVTPYQQAVRCIPPSWTGVTGRRVWCAQMHSADVKEIRMADSGLDAIGTQDFLSIDAGIRRVRKLLVFPGPNLHTHTHTIQVKKPTLVNDFSYSLLLNLRGNGATRHRGRCAQQSHYNLAVSNYQCCYHASVFFDQILASPRICWRRLPRILTVFWGLPKNNCD